MDSSRNAALEALHVAAQLAEQEAEPRGPMPLAMRIGAVFDPEKYTRAAVRATRKSIAKSIRRYAEQWRSPLYVICPEVQHPMDLENYCSKDPYGQVCVECDARRYPAPARAA